MKAHESGSTQIRNPEYDFSTDVGKILSTPLTPENIDTYATDALDQLILLIDDVTNTYSQHLGVEAKTDKSTEVEAFSFFGLQNINDVLDHISAKTTEIAGLDDVISNIPKSNRVITPPDPSREVTIVPGVGSAPESQKVPRLKTLLFLLSNEFSIDVNDRSQLSLETGELEDGMMREQSYVLVDAKSIGTVVLVCDEKGNATFVFDTNKLETLGMTGEAVAGLMKPELRDLLHEHPDLGQRVLYSKTFVSDMVQALYEPKTNNSPLDRRTEHAGQYLYPKPPEGYVSMRALARRLGLADSSVVREVQRLTEEGTIGDTSVFRFGTTPTIGLNIQQQQQVEEGLAERGLFAGLPPEGTLSRAGFAQELGLSVETIYKAVDTLLEEGGLQNVSVYRFGPLPHMGLNPEQQQTIITFLEGRGALAPQAPEDVLSIKAMAKLYGLDKSTVVKYVDELLADGVLGDVGNFKFKSGRAALGFNEAQREIIQDRLGKEGLFSAEAPEGVIALHELADELGVSRSTLGYTLQTLVESGAISPIKMYRFGNHVVAGVNQEQQQVMVTALEAKGTTAPKSPEGILTIAGIAKITNATHKAVDRAVKELDMLEELGKRNKFKFGANIAFGFDAEQQRRIIQHIQENRR